MSAALQSNATASILCRSWGSGPSQYKNPVTTCFHTPRRRDGRLALQRVDVWFETESALRLVSSRVACKAANATKDKKKTFSRDELTESQLGQWEEASSVLKKLGFEQDEADKMLGKAFGWVHSPYWTEKPDQIVPDPEKVSLVVDFVKGIGYSDAEVVPVFKKFPELLGCRESLLKHNVGLLEKDWGIAGKILKGLIKRNPQALGYNVDCRGDCMAQCTRCWVRF